jgi:hypothetical protein
MPPLRLLLLLAVLAWQVLVLPLQEAVPLLCRQVLLAVARVAGPPGWLVLAWLVVAMELLPH